MSGTLYVVSTPIGNLGDITFRAAEILRAVEGVAAEDTRRTRALLSHLDVRGKTLIKLDAHAARRSVESCLQRLERGDSLALVTDAGTPSVSDPGAALVARAAEREIAVVAVPGPSAVTAAVAVSGLVEGPFLFLAFLPRRGEKRRRAIERIAESREPVVLFEAPGRAGETLSELAEKMPDRSACVARELTKLHEEVRRGSLRELAGAPKPWRGEITIVIGAGAGAEPSAADDEALCAEIHRGLDSGRSPRTLAEELTRSTGRPKRAVYAAVLAAARGRQPDSTES